ncbi:nucleotide sugar dehydrogenase [Sulfitobacter sp. M57]|uniref:nucleotide sugar dehydrogenase n=3 Tax=Sulfitobacter TaxID=60136 RepID=UPI0023E32267|nr:MULTISPECIES: nucleotide sugar dehydrogenase [unclassified Sulfitobacter]MDF3416477.1 nucleotide sugar dehydrogenase [Sulfitobacter sp. KE5]MDF3423968.1 nucleotide sugar dehydrogenase [Sulfitobacter sp. KE43]MDF3435069.1 nucleotide sugar dehydrogenase [Sulfitobacter sp. KE42]MDF3460727.1 nucleotide sugar dehydrogenase [Sulfitobacter sp. S74]MDF3464566.1 nucleotide sugar dehydrogenase [Sulfitobacter sp. Ks18]
MLLLEKLKKIDATIGIVGLGYVGLPLANASAKAGYRVIGFDVDAGKIDKLYSGHSYIEAVSDADIEATADLSDWTVDFSRIKECDVVVICVPTPLNQHREPDLSFVEDTARVIAKHMTPDTLVVLESTTWPGTTEEVMKPLLAESGHAIGRDIFVGYSPEREDPGNATYRTKTIPKVIAGDGPDAQAMMEAFYGAVVETVVTVPNPTVAEAVKITENIFRSVNIALVNELKLIYDEMGIDIWEVIDGAATKPFGFMPFYPGPGLGGHCIPIDPFYLTWRARAFDVPTRFVELAGEINTNMPHHIVHRTREVLDLEKGKGLNGAKVLLVGVAYKKNVSDMRESPAMRLMQLFDEAGAEVAFVDPHVPVIPPMRDYAMFEGQTALSVDAIADGGFDVVVIATDHDAVEYEPLLKLGCPVIDTRNAIAKRGLPMDGVTKA